LVGIDFVHTCMRDATSLPVAANTNHSIPGREGVSAEHFSQFVGYLTKQKSNGTTPDVSQTRAPAPSRPSLTASSSVDYSQVMEPSSPPRLQQRRAAGARDEILEATRAVVARVGVPQLTLELVARELGITKQALYHYFPSKNALLFEAAHADHAAAARAMHAASAAAADGASAIEAVIRAYVTYFAPRLDAFRMLMMQVQQVDIATLPPDQLARLRPLNDLAYGEAETKLKADWRRTRGRIRDPHAARRLVFSAHLAAIGLLTMKSLTERFQDPLRYTDDELVEQLCRTFRAAAEKEPSR
jgi:AcrR family transcriptional regulator